jgi:hypothetical protein
MTSKIVCTEIHLPWFVVNALAFLPSPEVEIRPEWALFTHGYTSHKGDCLNWATRLVETGVPCIIFDQPGHYLGSFNEVESLQDFKEHVHELFGAAFNRLEILLSTGLGPGQYPSCRSVILAGHSMGAYTAIKALALPEFSSMQRLAIGVGIGIGQTQGAHIFETAFYQKTISFRRQLVSPAIDSREIFPWLKEAKEQLDVSGERIHLITGEDDVVVGPGGLEAMLAVLEKHGNEVSWERPRKLPHHEPGGAAPHLYAFLKNHFGWK